MRTLLKILLALAVLYGILCAAALAVMYQTPERFSRVMMHVPDAAFVVLPFKPLWLKARAGRLQVGDTAPGFALPTQDQKSTVQLASFQASQPVVLVFGSYTWPPFRREVPELNKIYEKYRDRAAFYVVYIQEAHALDAWQDDDNLKAHIFQRTEHTLSERCSVAATCVTKLGIEFPALVDDLANTTERAYTAWPDRLYVIDRDGRVVYKSKPGPYGFKPEEVSQTLEKLFPSTRAAVAPLPRNEVSAGGTLALQ